MEWLERHYPEEVQMATALGFFSFRDKIDDDLFEEFADDYGGILEFNYVEWLIADSILTIKDESFRTVDLLLSKNGPRFTADERKMLQVLRENRLRLYEITKTDHKNGFLYMKELPQKGRTGGTIEVYDKKASMTAAKKMKIACRIIPWDGQNILTGTMYEFAEELAKRYLQEEPLLKKEASFLSPEWQEHARTSYMISAWASGLLQSLASYREDDMQFVDQKTGDPIIFTTDLYDITNHDGFLEFTGSTEWIDVQDDGSWVWLSPPDDDGLSRPRGDLTLIDKKRLKVVSTTVQKADGIRTELEKALGKGIKFRTRQLEDVTSKKLRNESKRKRGSGKEVDRETLDAPELAEAMQNHIQAIYKNWADEPLPAFDNKTPRQMLSRRGGEKRVREMIELYELSARRQMVEQKMPLISYNFLYKELGLKP